MVILPTTRRLDLNIDGTVKNGYAHVAPNIVGPGLPFTETLAFNASKGGIQLYYIIIYSSTYIML